MKRHDAYVGLIRSTVAVFAIGFGWSSFVLADEKFQLVVFGLASPAILQ